MYFIDRGKIEKTLVYMEQKISFLSQLSTRESQIDQLAFERSAHVIIESILDVGNAMIDGFIMRDPGSYEDIIDILDDEKVLSKDMIQPLKQVVGARKSLVHHYIDVNHEAVHQIFKEANDALEAFPVKVRHYLTNELGPVSAFKN
ncbi:DUF86 domain-containing protein [Jeotgalibacillus sp. S-D1]|uniref:type VII toxin-antitoxin system HepT family RNase toxin n=1 Tax=Jeotgalibacillus sp. S-D1 TaxID=2552189 RepID=UPI00105A4CF7|nr:DUF86 domain-containing protein [Jeotgalibacillus sp. S-D1]TDL32461.1 DUF86 domain-containing protein [Jeotgalibacillus sp. S-D1]